MGRILLIEDSAVDAEMIKNRLGGHEITWVSDGWAGLCEASRQNQYELIITDLEMPRLNGNQLASIIQRSQIPFLREIPVFVITGTTNAFNAAVATIEGVQLVSKPFDESDVARVEEMINA